MMDALAADLISTDTDGRDLITVQIIRGESQPKLMSHHDRSPRVPSAQDNYILSNHKLTKLILSGLTWLQYTQHYRVSFHGVQ